MTGGEHSHVVAGRPVDSALRAAQPAENVASAHDQAYLHAERAYFLYGQREIFKYRGVEGFAGCGVFQGLPAEL